jgi:outer membrane receptor protein involved in Fe transport
MRVTLFVNGKRERAGIFVFVFLATNFCIAQAPTGQISGLVTDPSGAVAPGVRVEVIDQETHSRRLAVTNGSGFYTVTPLPPGRYRIETQKPGFQSMIRDGVTLAVAQSVRLDFTLEIGGVAQSVTVSTAVPLVDSQSASLGQVVQRQTVQDLPLNGRNYLQLAKLATGVSEAAHGDPTAANGAFVANGVRAQLTNYNLDGTDNNSRIVDVQNQSYAVIQPSIDALEEFKIETNSYAAEYGYSAGAVVNATLRSGTNRFHGTAFEFLRNDHLDARDYFLSPSSRKQTHQRNQFGGVLGGPIIRNKTFFLASWERTAENQGEALVTTLPSATMAGGNFQSALPIYDPASTTQSGSIFTRTLFPNNVVPATRIDPVAAKLAALLPAPNVAGAAANNYISSPSQITRANRIDSRADQNFSDNNKLFLRYSYFSQAFTNPGVLPAPLIGATGNTQNNHATQALSGAIGWTHIFSATLVNEATTGYSRIYDNRGDLVSGPFLGSQYGFQGIPYTDGIGGLPNMSISGYSSLGEATNVPNKKIAEVSQFKDNFTWIHGGHTFKFGGQYEWVRSFFAVSSSARGTYSFTGVFTQNPQSRSNTGNGFADFLLGDANSAGVSTQTVGDVRQKYSAAFAQDDWKVTRKLTLNLGIRYEIWTPRVERNNLQANFLPGSNQIIFPDNARPSSIASNSIGGIPDGIGNRSLVRSYDANFAPRLGVAYQLTSRTVLRSGAGVFYASPNFPGVGVTPPGNPPYLVSASYPSDQLHPSITLSGGFPADALNPKTISLASTSLSAFELNFKPAYVAKWSAGLEQQISGFVLEANYVGTRGVHLPFFYNLNQPYPGAGSVASREPFQGLNTINYTSVIGASSYHALETRLERALSHGLQFLVSYTYSKAIDSGGEQLDGDTTLRNAQNIDAERSLATFDERHRFVTSFLYALPVGKGQALNLSNRYLDAALGHWQINGVFTDRSGQPFTPELNFSPANSGDGRPNRIADGNLPSGQHTVAHWFDTSAFQAGPNYVFGNAGRNIVIGPGAVNVDFSAFKSFPMPFLGENGSAQFRAEFFNILNHPQFSLPNSTVNIPQGGSITSTASAMRQIQFGLKILF